MQYLDGHIHVRIIYQNFLTPSPKYIFSHPNTVNVRTCVCVCVVYKPVPIAYWIRHPLREREVEGSIPSVGDIGVRSDMAGW